MAEETGGIELPKRQRNPDDGELDITPMIDVTFLLLAFFVVVSKMDPQAAVPLPMASYGESISEKNAVTLILVVDPSNSDRPMIYKGTSMSEDSLVGDGDEEAQEQDIAEWVENELFANPTKDAVIIKAAGNCKTKMVELVKRGVSKSELARSEGRRLFIGIEEEQ
ncbi:MAG: biopolymer transporter ExbD [Planctomycetota bacterium]